MEALGVAPVSGLKQVSTGLLLSFLLKWNQKPQAKPSIICYLVLKRLNWEQTPLQSRCVTWIRGVKKQFLHQVNKHLPPMTERLHLLRILLLYSIATWAIKRAQKTAGHIWFLVCLYEKVCDKKEPCTYKQGKWWSMARIYSVNTAVNMAKVPSLCWP